MTVRVHPSHDVPLPGLIPGNVKPCNTPLCPGFMWVDFELAGTTYQKAVSKNFPFTLGPPAGCPGAETDAKLF
eukprot:9812586-Heterocapsa_arctica.AAC.1